MAEAVVRAHGIELFECLRDRLFETEEAVGRLWVEMFVPWVAGGVNSFAVCGECVFQLRQDGVPEADGRLGQEDAVKLVLIDPLKE